MPFVSSLRGSFGAQGRFGKKPSILRLNWYDEGGDARNNISNWNDTQTYNMTSTPDFGNVWMHGWGGSARTYILTVNNLPDHDELRFSAVIHHVDSWDNETNNVRVNNSDGSERALISYTKNLSTTSLDNVVLSNGATYTQSFNRQYSYSPWGNNPVGNGYIVINSGWYPHTRNQFQAWFYTGLDQPQSDEAYYISHVKFDLR